MSIFWLNNFHFAIEFFGAVALVTAAWLAFDAWLLTHEKKALLKVLGFGFFAAWQVLHALDITEERSLFSGMVLLVAGVLFIALNVYRESPPARPQKFELIFVIPSVAGLLGNAFLAAGILALVAAAIALRRYMAELNKPLKLFWAGFGFLAASFFFGYLSVQRLAPGALWVIEHALRACGFGILTIWTWQYLRLRMKEELLLGFVAMSLFVSLVVTFTFSALLLARMRADAAQSLQANAKVFSYTLSRMREEAKSKSMLAARDAALVASVTAQDFPGIEEGVKRLREALGVDFVTVTDASGAVIQRATYRTARSEMLVQDPAVSSAIGGKSFGDIGALPPEGLSVRGASPMFDARGAVLGITEVGFLVDNVFLENIKRVTGLDASVYAGDLLYASTILDIDGVTRPVGTMLSDSAVRSRVLEGRASYTGTVNFLGRPHLASYLPLADSRGAALGMIAASRPEVEISKAAIATNRLTLFTTLAIVLALLMPAYFIVRKITDEV